MKCKKVLSGCDEQSKMAQMVHKCAIMSHLEILPKYVSKNPKLLSATLYLHQFSQMERSDVASWFTRGFGPQLHQSEGVFSLTNANFCEAEI